MGELVIQYHDFENAKKEKEIFDCLKEFGVENTKESPWTKDNKTPVFDAIQLMEMEGK